MKRVDPEFAYQSRELDGQIEGILGDPPDRKNYRRMVEALRSEYADGNGIEDVNMMSFALVDVLQFKNIQGLLRESSHYHDGDVEAVLAMAGCDDEGDQAMFERMAEDHPELTRQAVITAFLYKNPRLWSDEDSSLDSLAEGDEGDELEGDEDVASADFEALFDQQEDDNGR